MATPRRTYEKLLRRIASAVSATELAAFSIEADDSRLRTLCHVRPGNSDSKQREAAIAGFQDIVRICLESAEDGAIEIVEKESARDPQFCLVVLARRAGAIVGAAAFIVRCATSNAAQVVLKRIQEDTKRFRFGPTEAP